MIYDKHVQTGLLLWFALLHTLGLIQCAHHAAISLYPQDNYSKKRDSENRIQPQKKEEKVSVETFASA